MKYPRRTIRLIVLTPLFPPAVGGASEDFRILTEAWSHTDNVEEVLIVTERCCGSSVYQSRDKISVRRVLPARDTQPRLNVAHRLVRSAITYLFVPLVVAWYFHQGGFDAVLVHGRYGKKALLKILKLLRVRVVLFLSDLFTPLTQLVNCDAVICNSETVFQRAAAQLSGGCQVHHVPLPFEFPRTTEQTGLRDRATSPYFLFVGNISRDKGVDVLLEAFSAFRKDHPEHRLLLAGPVRDPSLIPETCGVTSLGEVGRTTITALMQRAEAVVLPSRSESLPRVCLEAIALGTKVICPPGVPELQRALPEWTLTAVTVPDVLSKLEQTLRSSRAPAFDFAKHDPNKAARRIVEVCMALSEPVKHSLRFA